MRRRARKRTACRRRRAAAMTRTASRRPPPRPAATIACYASSPRYSATPTNYPVPLFLSFLSLSLEPSTWLSSGRCLTLTPACPHITGGARAIRGQQHLRHPAVPARRGAGGRGHVGDGRHAHGRRGPGRALGRVAGRRRPFATAHSVALAVTLQRRQPHTFVFALLRSVAFLWLLSHQASKSGWGDVTEHISYRLTLLFEGADAGEWRGATVTPHGAAALHLTDRYVHSSHPSLMHDVTPRVSACVLARTV